MATASKQPPDKTAVLSRVVVFVILMTFWLVFSGHYDWFHITLGILCCMTVAYASHDLMISDINSGSKLRKSLRFIGYLPWLLYQVVLSNIHVVRLIFSSKDITPEIVTFKSSLKHDFSRVSLANSITLTPGTVTIGLDDEGTFQVHAISKATADDIRDGEMERRIARVFMDGNDEKTEASQ